MTAILALLSQYKFYILLAVGLFLLIMFYGNYREDKGRSELQRDIELAPVRHSDTVMVHDTIRPPIQELSGTGRRRGGDMLIFQSDKPPELDTDYCRQLWEENQILKEETGIVSEDSLGGIHEITYKPTDNFFNEKYTPPPLIFDRTTITNTKVIFEERFLSLYPLASYRNDFAFGGLVGIDKIVIGGLFGKESPQWLAGIRIQF